MYTIRMGIPEMEAFWSSLEGKVDNKTASKDELKLYKKIGKALVLLANDPRYPGLNSHEITTLSRRYGQKVWESYLENQTPAAGRLFWTYGPGQVEITIIAIEPHPNDKANAYKKITLSSMGEVLQ